MANTKSGLASLYDTKINKIFETVKTERDDLQKALENAGFTVTRDDHPLKYEATHSLIANKGNVTLEVSQLLRGGKTFSVIIKDGNGEKSLRLFTDKLEEAMAHAEAAQYLVK